MPQLDPTVALATCERALRHLLGHVLERKFGATWLAQVSTEEQREDWRQKAEEEAAKRRKRGVAVIPEGPLAYTQFWDLRKLAGKHWDLLAPALGKKAEVDPLLKRMEDLRNTLGHGREVLPFEADLVSGIAGEIRNRVTIYISSQDPSGDYYPRLELVRDQFGNSYGPESPTIQTGVTLRLGDSVTFECRAVDPQARAIHWELFSQQVGSLVTAEGEAVCLRWDIVQAVEVNEKAVVYIRMKSSGPYHRLSTFDDFASFSYRVLPPM